MTDHSRSTLRRALAAGSAIGAMLMLTACPPKGPQVPPSIFNNDARLVFPRTTGAITIDGIGPVVAAGGDAAWDNDAFAFELEQGALVPAATMRGVSTDTDFYLYFDAEDGAYDASDQLVLTLNPDGAATNYHRFIIGPCPASGSACPGSGGVVAGGITPTVSYATGSESGGLVNWTNAATPGAADFEVKSNVSQAGSANRWTVELRISRTALGGFNENWMGLFADAIVADENAFTTTQYSWPTGLAVTNVLFGAGNNDYPQISQWGSATLSTFFGNGVSIGYHEFGSNQADPSEIALNAPNSFHAYAVNNQSDGGTLVQADAVSATFQIINNGLGGGWANIPVGGNPAGPANIPAAGAHYFETGIWNLTPQQVIDYTANPQQCVQVVLSSTDPDTVIAQGTARRNMRFVTVNSPFEGSNAMSLRGFEKLASESEPAYILRERFLNLPKDFRWQTRLSGAEKIGEGTWKVPLGRQEDTKLGVWVSPDDRLTLDSKRVMVPAQGDKAVTFDVEPGTVLTMIADGSVELGKLTVTAGGLSATSLKRSEVNLEERGKLREGRPDRYGLLLGSFDGFETSFPIGNGTTVVVPDGAQQLQMMINDGDKGAEMRGGRGFSVQMIATPRTPQMASTFAGLASAGGKGGFLAPLGANLPSWIVRGDLVTDRFVTINDKRFRVLIPAGSFGYTIRDVGVRRTPVGDRVLTNLPVR